jgi:hypothetical protein
MGSLQNELKRVVEAPSAPQAPTPVAQGPKLEPSSSLAESVEAVCKEFADRLQPLLVELERGNGQYRNTKIAVKMLHERVVNARRVAAEGR